MIVLVLILVVSGSFLSSGMLFMQGASWGMIGLSYVLGGWAGLVIGALLLALWRILPNVPALSHMTPTEDRS